MSEQEQFKRWREENDRLIDTYNFPDDAMLLAYQAGLNASAQQPVAEQPQEDITADMCIELAEQLQVVAFENHISEVKVIASKMQEGAFRSGMEMALEEIEARISIENLSSKQPVAEQEPVAWMWQHEETGRIGFVDLYQIENGWEEAMRLKLSMPLYTSQQPVQPVAAENCKLLLAACGQAMQIAMSNNLPTDWRNMIAAINDGLSAAPDAEKS